MHFETRIYAPSITHLTLYIRSVLLTNVSNQAPQLPQTSHSPHHCDPTPYPTPDSRSETLHYPRNSSPYPIVDTYLVPPGVPFEIPYPICHRAIERRECHHHNERDIVQSSSSNLRAHWNPFTIFQVLRSPSFLSLGLYFQVPYGLEASSHCSPPSLPIPAPSFIDSIIQNIQYSIARPIPRPETARGLSQSTRESHHSWNLAQYCCTRSNVFSSSNTSRKRDHQVYIKHCTFSSSGTNSATRNLPTHCTLPYLSNQIIEVVARLSGVRPRWGQGQSEPIQETGPHQETLTCRLSSGNQSLDEWSPRVHLYTSGWMATSPNSEVPDILQAHSTLPPQYLHGRGGSSSLTLPSYEDSPTVQVTADANPLPSSRSEVSSPSHSLHHPDCWIWSHLHHQWLMLF